MVIYDKSVFTSFGGSQLQISKILLTHNFPKAMFRNTNKQ